MAGLARTTQISRKKRKKTESSGVQQVHPQQAAVGQAPPAKAAAPQAPPPPPAGAGSTRSNDNNLFTENRRKAPLSFNGYVLLCKTLMTIHPVGLHRRWNESTFGWSFFACAWNLMGRSVNVASIHLAHVDYWEEGDSLTVRYATNKMMDQGGEKSEYATHIYANPLMSEICAILSLAVFELCKHRIQTASGGSSLMSGQSLFGTSSSDRFSSILQQVVTGLPDNADLGCNRKLIGTHGSSPLSTEPTFLLDLERFPSAPPWQTECTLRVQESCRADKRLH